MLTPYLFLFAILSACEVDDGAINGPYCDDEQFEDDPCKCYQVEGAPDCPDTGEAE